LCYVACVTDEDVARRYELVRPHLDERSRRLVLGAEALALGRGGIRRVQSVEPPDGRVRRPGAVLSVTSDEDDGVVVS